MASRDQIEQLVLGDAEWAQVVCAQIERDSRKQQADEAAVLCMTLELARAPEEVLNWAKVRARQARIAADWAANQAKMIEAHYKAAKAPKGDQ